MPGESRAEQSEVWEDDMPRYSHRSRTRRRNRGRFGPLFKLLCVLAVVVALTAGATVFFRVERISVSGCKRYTPEEIIAASGIQVGENLYSLNKVSIDRSIRTKLPYVEELTINRALPSTILITVAECEAAAQVSVPDPAQAAAAQEELAAGDPDAKPALLAQEPWLISEKGKLLEPAPADSAAIPVAGLTSVDPAAGSLMKVPESEQTRLDALTALLQAAQEEELTGELSSIRLEATRLTVRYAGRFDVEMKLNSDFRYSLRLMCAVREQLEELHGPQVAGTIDLTLEQYDAAFSLAE